MTSHASILKKQEAIDAAQRLRKLDKEIAELEKEHGITAKRQARLEIGTLLKGYMMRQEISRLDDGKKSHVALVRPASRRWIGTKAEMPNPKPKGAKPLKSLVDKVMWRKVTKRVIDPELIAELVESGELDEDEIAPAYVEIPSEPYVRLY